MGTSSARTQIPMRVDLDEAREQIAAALDGAPINPRLPYAEQLHAQLRRAIVRGRLPPGTPLSEVAIASAVGVSRTPVREALRLLVQEELVLVFPQAGTLVAPVRLGLIHQSRFIRRALECANLADLVKCVNDAQLAELEGLIAGQRAALDAGCTDEFFRLDEAMHRRMLEFTGREGVWSQIEASKLHFDRVRWLLLERVTEHAERAFREHKVIIQRLAARDGTRLVKSMHQHIDAVANDLLELRGRAPEGYLVD